jgi:hypothetical protein
VIEGRESRCGKKNGLHEEKGVQEEKATERRERGCRKKMDNNEEKEDARRSWITMNRKRMREDHG